MNGNITTAPLGGNRNIKTKPLYQYDYGQVLKIVGVTLPAAYEVHFSNQLHGVATIQIGNADGVVIPDIYLTTGEPVYAWVYLHTGTDDGETEYTITIPVVRRASISDAEPTPVQQDVITQAIAALDAAVAQTAQDVQDATEAKQDAEEAAGNAYESAVAAAQSAANAGTYAGQAQSAQAASELAQQKAEEAQTGAQTAKWAAESAQTGAEAAQAGAVAARTGAETAQAWAVAARSGAEAAQHAAEAARDEITGLSATANTLPAGAQATASYADGTLTLGIPQGVKGDTGDTGATPDFTIGTVQTLPAGSSATATITGTDEQPVLNLGIPRGDQGEVSQAELSALSTGLTSDLDLVQTSGTIVETEDAFPTFAEDVTAEIVPVQDLHGYDSPWPAGGGKNKLPNENGTYKGTTGNNIYIVESESPVSLPAGTYYIKYFADKSTGLALAGFYLSINGGTASRIGSNHATQETVESFVLAEQSNITLRLYSSTTGFNEAKYRFMLTVEDSTNIAFSPYSNICPISGWDEVRVTRTGRNLVPMSAVSRTNAGITYTVNNDGSVTIDGTATATSWLRGQTYVNERQFLKAGTYHLSGSPSNHNCTVYIVGSYTDGEGLLNATVPGGVYDNGNGLTFTLRKDATVTYQIQVNNGTAVSNLTVYPQIELGSTVTPYEPYHGIQVELPFGQIVYGGTIDLTTGKLTVTHAHALLNDPTKWVTSTSGTTPFVYNEYFTDRAKYTDSYTGLVCSYAKVNSATQNNTARWSGATSNTFGFNLSSTSITIDDIKAAAQNGEIEIMYPLATPQIYDLTPAQVLLLRDYNVLWANTGDIINLEYRAGSFVPKKTYDALKEATLIHSTASGSIASFSDGAEMPVDEVTVQINPVQDLHGYENPWPAGGNLNLLDFSKVSVSGTYYGMTFSKGTAEGTVVISGTLTTSSGAVAPITYANNSLSGKGYVFLTEYISGDSVIALNRTYGFRTESERAIAVYLEGNAGQSYTETIRVSVYATTQTAWTPYANICPISGFDGLTVTRTGKNFLNPAKYEWQTRTFNGITYTVLSDGSVRAVGTSTAAGGPGLTSRFQLPAGTYYGNSSTGSGLSVLYRYAMQETGGTTYPMNNPFVSDGTQWFYINLYCNAANLTVDTVLYPQIELGTYFTGFEPYQGNTYTIQMPTEAGTVYGGSLTIADDGNGVLTVDRIIDTPTSVYGSQIEGNGRCYLYSPGRVALSKNLSKMPLCDILKSTSQTRATFAVCQYGGGANIYFISLDDTYDTIAKYNAWLAENKPTIILWIIEPITYSLTASQITTLLGQNNLWHDANGEITVGYKANTKLYIDGKIAELVAQIVNS